VKVLLSWSGARSEAIALALKDWVPRVVPCADPWVSSEDIRKGKRWTGELANILEETQFGIFVMLQENRGSSWLHFEAGAISKWVSASNVAPLLIDMSLGELEGPLGQFQATRYDEEDLLRLMKDLNAECPDPLTEEDLQARFSSNWADLQQGVTSIMETVPAMPAQAAGQSGVHDLELNEEHMEILTAVGSSAGNWLPLTDLSGSIGMKRARLVQRLEELVQAGYLEVDRTPMVGLGYSAAARGRRYLMDKGII
jgi:hypothetical protein